MRRGVVVVLVALVGVVGCAGIDTESEESSAADEFAAAAAERLSDLLERGDVGDLQPADAVELLYDLELPTSLDAVNVLDVGVSGASSDGTMRGIGIDAAAAMQFMDRDAPVCVHLAAASSGESNAVVADHIPLNECDSAGLSELEEPEYRDASQLFSSES